MKKGRSEIPWDWSNGCGHAKCVKTYIVHIFLTRIICYSCFEPKLRDRDIAIIRSNDDKQHKLN